MCPRKTQIIKDRGRLTGMQRWVSEVREVREVRERYLSN
jgi:hypothetical protein